jgi:hypothetical protein
MSLRNLFQREGSDSPSTYLETGMHTVEDLRHEYLELVDDALDRGGIAVGCVEVEIRHMGTDKAGKPLFSAMLRMTRWERRSGTRLLLGLPLMERAVRKLLGGSWLLDVSSFAGIWLHPATSVLGREVARDISVLLAQVEQTTGGATPAESMWSLPAELASDPPTHS